MFLLEENELQTDAKIQFLKNVRAPSIWNHWYAFKILFKAFTGMNSWHYESILNSFFFP